MTESPRRFPTPADKIPGGYIVRDASGQALASSTRATMLRKRCRRRCSRGRGATGRGQYRKAPRTTAPEERRLNRRPVQMPRPLRRRRPCRQGPHTDLDERSRPARHRYRRCALSDGSGGRPIRGGVPIRPSLDGGMSGLTPTPTKRVHDPSGVATHAVALGSAGQSAFRSARVVMDAPSDKESPAGEAGLGFCLN